MMRTFPKERLTYYARESVFKDVGPRLPWQHCFIAKLKLICQCEIAQPLCMIGVCVVWIRKRGENGLMTTCGVQI